MKNLRHVLGKITDPISQQQGFVKAAILLDWHLIVGEKFAANCQPEKITFPYERRTNGRLSLKTTSSFALEIAHLEPMIVEKINRYFGYKAVERLTINHGLVRQKTPVKKKPVVLPVEIAQSIDDQVQNVTDEKLRKALSNFGKSLHQDLLK